MSATDGSLLEFWEDGLPASSNGTTTTYEIVAYNTLDQASEPELVTFSIDNSGSGQTPTLNQTGVPSQPAVETIYNGGFRLRVPALASAGSNPNVPIASYTIFVYRDTDISTPVASCVFDARTPPLTAPFSCVVNGLNPSHRYRFKTRVENVFGASVTHGYRESGTTNTSPNPQPNSGGTPPAATNQPPLPAPTPPTPPVVPPAEPLPIVDLDLQGGDASEVKIPGAVAVPQGTFRVENPGGHPVRVIGGVLAAELEVNDGRVTSVACQTPAVPVPGENCVDLGFEAEAIQVRLRIVSRVPNGNETSVAIVQINENGATAVNSWEVQSVAPPH